MSQNPYGPYGSVPENPEATNSQTQNLNQTANSADQAHLQQTTNGFYNAQTGNTGYPNYQSNYNTADAPQQNFQNPQVAQSAQPVTPTYPNAAPVYGSSPYNQTPVNPVPGQEFCAPRPHVNFAGSVSRWAKNLFHFSGRASRSEFWWTWGLFYLINMLVGSIAAIPFQKDMTDLVDTTKEFGSLSDSAKSLNQATYDDYVSSMLGHILGDFALSFFVGLIFVVLMLSLTWRRLQDAGFHGAWSLLNLVGLNIVTFIMAFFGSKPEGCKYDRPADVNRP